MQFINIVKLLLFIALFSGCAHKYLKDPTLKFEQKSFKLDCNSQNYTMLVGQDGENFAIFDALMVPIVQKTYKKDRFVSSKFLPPNSKFDPLFSHTLEMIKKEVFSFEFASDKLNCKVKEL